MILCSSCACHVQRWELRCPHCGVVRPLALDTAWAAKLAFVVIGMVGVSGCGDDVASSTDGATVTTAQDPETSGTSNSETTGVISTSTGESTSTEGGMIPFVPDDDFAAAYGECDPWQQDCPEGEKCVPYGSTGGPHYDAQKCVQITNDGMAGDECTYAGIVEGNDSCDADSFCWPTQGPEDQLVGHCTAFCTGTPDDPMCPAEYSCLISNDGSINFCVPECNPLDPEPTCANDWSCHYQESPGIFGCWLGDVGEGETCVGGDQLYDDCGEGLTCYDGEHLPMCEGDRCCAAFCDVSDPMCNAPGTTCTTLWENAMAPPGYENLGVCIVP